MSWTPHGFVELRRIADYGDNFPRVPHYVWSRSHTLTKFTTTPQHSCKLCCYPSYRSLSVSSNKPGHDPMTSLINNAFLSEPPLTGSFMFFSPFWVKTLDTVVCEHPRRSAGAKMLKTSLYGTENHPRVKVTEINISSHFYIRFQH